MEVIRKLKKILNKKGNEEMNFERISAEWLEYKRNNVKESTYYNYMYNIERYLKPFFNQRNIDEISNYNDFIQELKEKYALETIKRIVNVLKSILNYYQDEYNVILKTKKITLPKAEKRKVKILSNKEKEKLEKYCLEVNTLKSLGIIICLNTGLRIGEICALKWKNIDLEEKIIYIEQTIQRVYIKQDKKSKIIIDKPKSSYSIRTIPMNKKVYNILKSIQKNYKESDFLLTGDSQKFVEPRNYQHNFQVFLKNSKIKHYKFHSLRHTFATACIEVGMDIKSLSEILGHSNTTITLDIYVHSSDKIKKKYLEKL